MGWIHENLAVVGASRPELADELRRRGGGVLEVIPARNGLPTARRSGRWLHSAYDPWKEAEAWADHAMAEHREGETLVVLGAGLLYHVEAVVRRVPQDTVVWTFVEDLGALYDALSVRNLAGWGERVRWIWRPEEVPHIGERQPVRLLTYQPVASLYESQMRELTNVLRGQIASRQSGRLRLAVIGPIYGGSLPIARYVVRALEGLGHQVKWIDHSVHHPGYQTLDGLRDPRLRMTMQSRFGETLGIISLAHLAEDPPDLVLALSQAPLSLAVLEQLRRKKILTAMWFVENVRHLTYWQQVATGYDFWFIMQKEPCITMLKQAGARHVAYLPLAADPAIHRPLQLTERERDEYGADVSFLGAGYHNRRLLLPTLLNHGWSFKLWGNEWGEAGSLQSVLQRNGARVDTETSVKIFNATTINLNLHSYTGPGFDPEGDGVNPRTFEIAACGAFQVVDDRSLLSELFTASMMGIVQSPNQLVPVTKAFLHDPAARTAMATEARRQVLLRHTYSHRMETLLAELGVHSPDRIGSVLRGERSVEALCSKAETLPELQSLLREFPEGKRIELKEMAEKIRARGATAVLSRAEMLLLMMDEYRQETRDFV